MVQDHGDSAQHHSQRDRPYRMFAMNMILSLIVMYLVMFSMITGWGDFRNNLNMFYMALTMVAPMGIIMLATMGGMYRKRRLNISIHVGLGVLFMLALAGTRSQTFIGDRQFVRSMIPHHSGAILMCEQANLSDEALVTLCEDIIRAQREEIDQMNDILARLNRPR